MSARLKRTTTLGQARLGRSFDPYVYGTPRLWLDSRWVSGVGTPNPADNTALTTWKDLSTNGYDLTQATSTKRPLFYSSTKKTDRRSQPVVKFDGTDDFLANTAATSTAQPLTVYMVLSQDSVAVGSGCVLFEHSTGGTTIQHGLGSGLQLNFYAGTSQTGSTVSGVAQVITAQVFNGASSLIGEYLGGDIPLNPGTGSTGTGFTMGSERTQFAGLFFKGWFACVVVYTAAHSAATRELIMADLADTF